MHEVHKAWAASASHLDGGRGGRPDRGERVRLRTVGGLGDPGGRPRPRCSGGLPGRRRVPRPVRDHQHAGVPGARHLNAESAATCRWRRILDITVQEAAARAAARTTGTSCSSPRPRCRGCSEIRFVRRHRRAGRRAAGDDAARRSAGDGARAGRRHVSVQRREDGSGTRPGHRPPRGAAPAELPFDPIEEAARPVVAALGRGAADAGGDLADAGAPAGATELDERLRPLGLTFARYEVLVLLSSRGAAPCRWARSASGCRCTRPRSRRWSSGSRRPS